MKWMRLFPVLATALLLAAGCSRGQTPVPAGTPNPFLPTNAQPRLSTRTLYVGPLELTAEIARRPREIMTGMMFRTNVVDGDAMLFVLAQPQQAAFWMKNCPTPLSCAYIDPEGIIREIHPMQPLNTNAIVAEAHNILFVLETPDGWFDRNQIRTGMLVRTESGSLIETFFQPGSR